MRILNQYKISMVIVIMICVHANTLFAGLYKERSLFLRNLRWVLIEIINLDKENKEKLQVFRDSLKKDVASTLRIAGVKVKITENREDIGDNDYLKIRVHKIVLERTVYLSAIEMVTSKKKNKKENNEMKLRYTDVADRFESVKSIITDRIKKMVNWYIQ